MTLETMMAAASNGPRRRSSVCEEEAVVVDTGGLYVSMRLATHPPQPTRTA
jgi:hypothetical protein